jgi:hypothetical protein
MMIPKSTLPMILDCKMVFNVHGRPVGRLKFQIIILFLFCSSLRRCKSVKNFHFKIAGF